MIYGGSTFYIKSKHVNENDNRINNNDYKGVFYSYWKKARVNTYFFDYDEYVFLIETDKASKRLEPIQNRIKRGPEIISRYKWNEDDEQWYVFRTSSCDLTKCCQVHSQYNFSSITDLGENSINKERLICLANGKADTKHWFKPNENASFLINDDQINNRVVFHHDPDTDAQQNKEILIARYGEMVTTIVTDPDSFPERFADLRNDCQIKYIPNPENLDSYSINAQNSDGTAATLIYLGDCLEIRAEEKLRLIRNNFPNSQGAKRILIWYRQNGLKQKFVSDDPNISENIDQSSISYKRTIE